MAHRKIPPEDRFWLGLDRPTNLLVITSVLWTSEPVDPDRLRAVVQERLIDRYPVFHRRPVLGGGPLPAAYWVDDRDFDLDRHLLVHPMPAPGTQEALQDFVAAQRSLPLDPEHPLWTVQLLQGYGSGSAIVQRYHHAMADGIRLTQVMLGILDPIDGDRAPAATVGGTGPLHDGEHLSTHAAGLARQYGAGPLLHATSALTHLLPGVVRPGHLLDLAADTAVTMLNTTGSVAKIAAWTNPFTVLAGEPGIDKTAVWGDPVPLATLSGIAHANDTTVNVVCTTLLAGAVSRYLVEHGAELDGDAGDLAWLVPVNLEPLDRELPAELGNHFALVLAVLPHGQATFHKRLTEVHARLARIRDSYEPMLTFGLSKGLALTPAPLGTTISDLIAGKAVGVLTNVPGPRAPMTLAGARVEGVVGWAPCSARQAVTACVFSYAGQVTVGFGTDRAVIPDPERLIAHFDAELAACVGAGTSADSAATAVRPIMR